jgi:hypothetical protein
MTIALLVVVVVPLYLAITTVLENTDLLVDWSKSLATLSLPRPPEWVQTVPLSPGAKSPVRERYERRVARCIPRPETARPRPEHLRHEHRSGARSVLLDRRDGSASDYHGGAGIHADLGLQDGLAVLLGCIDLMSPLPSIFYMNVDMQEGPDER